MDYIFYDLGWVAIIAVAVAIVTLFVKIGNLKERQGELEQMIRGMKQAGKTGSAVAQPMAAQGDGPRYVVGAEDAVSAPGTETTESRAVEKNHEYNIGSKVIPAIGIISVLFGMGFFLKYTFDHNLIDETGRVILGFVIGVIFVAVGEKLRNRFAGYSALLMGGGFAILYLSAKFGLIYDLYANSVGFILMTVITVAAVMIAYKTNSRVIALVALLGGFLNPLLAFEDQPNEVVLFNYILLLLAGMVFLAWKKGWLGLIVGSAMGTIILYADSFSQYYANSEFMLYWVYLVIFFVIFTVAPFLLYFSKKSKYQIFNYGNLVLPVVSGGVFMAVSYGMFKGMELGEWDYSNTDYSEGYGSQQPQLINAVPIFQQLYFVIGLIPAVLYIVLSKISLQRFRQIGDPKPVYFFIAMAAFAIALIPALQFSGKWITFAWLAEAFVLAMIAFKTKTKVFLNIGSLVLAAGLVRLFTEDAYLRVQEFSDTLDEWVTVFTPIVNERALIFVVAAAVTFTLAYIGVKNGRKTLAKILGIAGNIIVLSWIWMEIGSATSGHYLSSDGGSVLLSVVYMAYASIMMWMGIVKNYAGFRVFAIVLFGFVVAKAYLVDIWDLSEILRILAFIVLGLVTLGVGYYYTKNKEKIKSFLKD